MFFFYLFALCFRFIYSDCPSSYPYSPRNGVFSGASWEYFCDYWQLEQPGYGNISFSAKGNDIYVGIFDTDSTKNFKYALVIGGWSNTETHLYKRGSFKNSLYTSKFSIENVSNWNRFQISVNKYKNSISLYYQGKMMFNFIDSNFAAASSKYVSFSQYSTNVQIKELFCPSWPYSPKNAVNSGGDWEYFCNDWILPDSGTGIVKFSAKGNDWYLGLFDEIFTNYFEFLIIFSGWNNSQTAIKENGNLSNLVYSAPVFIENVTIFNNFTVLFNKNISLITINMNGEWVFSYRPSSIKGKWISFSQYSNNVLIQNVTIQAACIASNDIFWLRTMNQNYEFIQISYKNSEYRLAIGDYLTCGTFPNVLNVKNFESQNSSKKWSSVNIFLTLSLIFIVVFLFN